MCRSLRFVLLNVVAALFLQLAASAQGNSAAPSPQQSQPSQPPAPPSQPTRPLPPAPPSNAPTITPASQELPWYMKVPNVMPENDRRNRNKIGQGILYAPEENVPREPGREYRKGLKALEKNEIKQAEEHFLRATQLYPKFSSAFNGLGYAYQLDPDERDKKTGRNPAAKKAYQQALALNPNNFNALVNFGYLLVAENQGSEAERALRTAIAIQAGSAKAYAGLMLAETLQHHFEDVLVTAKRIPNGGEDKFPIVVYLRAIAWENKPDREKAARDYRDFVKRAPDAPQAQLAQAALKRLEVNR